jgi:hypothetical protein
MLSMNIHALIDDVFFSKELFHLKLYEKLIHVIINEYNIRIFGNVLFLPSYEALH